MKKIRCLKCGHVITIDKAEAGKSWRCPKCRTRILSYPREMLVAQNAICAYCGSLISDSEVSVSCPNCRLEYHEDCWRDGEGCQTVGCDYQGTLKKTERIEATSDSQTDDYSFVPPVDDPFAPAIDYPYADSQFASVDFPYEQTDSPPKKNKTGLFRFGFFLLLVCVGKTFIVISTIFRFLERLALRIGNFYVNSAKSLKGSPAPSFNDFPQ